MENPVITALSAGVWTKVAAGVKEGAIRRQLTTPGLYRVESVPENDPAPTGDGAPAFADWIEWAFSSATTIDVYVQAATSGGRIRVDVYE